MQQQYRQQQQQPIEQVSNSMSDTLVIDTLVMRLSDVRQQQILGQQIAMLLVWFGCCCRR